jgi:hypothetical protein
MAWTLACDALRKSPVPRELRPTQPDPGGWPSSEGYRRLSIAPRNSQCGKQRTLTTELCTGGFLCFCSSGKSTVLGALLHP